MSAQLTSGGDVLDRRLALAADRGWSADRLGGAIARKNVAALVLRHATENPSAIALVLPASRAGGLGGAGRAIAVTYRELGERIASLAAGLARAGLEPGDRVAVLFPLGLDFFALILAALVNGVVPVVVDGSMVARRIVRALADARPHAVFSVRAVLRWWPVVAPLRRAQRVSMDGAGFGCTSLAELCAGAPAGVRLAPASRGASDLALISFTSGSTGRPKGAERTHGLLRAQHQALLELLPPEADEVSMPCFPMVALHNLCCGIMTVLPPIEVRAPAGGDAARVLAHLSDWQVTTLSAAPALVERLVAHMARRHVRLPSVRRVVVGGAPVSAALCARIVEAFPNADARVVYGSTEAEPIATVPMRDVIAARGDGVLVGAPVASIEVALLSLATPGGGELGDAGIAPHLAPPGEPGEIVVRGAHVNRGYVNNPAATRATKLVDRDGGLWHRTGDVAHFDARGRLWLTGRVADLVRHCGRTLHPLAVELDVEAIPGVQRAALVGVPPRWPGKAPQTVLAVQRWPRPDDCLPHVRALLASLGLGTVRVVRVDRIPLDARHQSKVDRVALRRRLRRAWR